MEYIIFLLTIQCPFLYLIWKFFQKQNISSNSAMRSLKEQQEHITNFMDTLRLSVERMSEDIYGNGKVNARMFHIEKEFRELKKQFRQMEIYTGLNTGPSALDDLPSSSSLKEKDFK